MNSPFIISYLFLGGASAGMALVLSLLFFRVPQNRLVLRGGVRMRASGPYAKFFGMGFLVAAVLCTIAAFFLIADMRNPDAILQMIFHPSFSVVSVGAYALGLCILLASAQTWIWLRGVFVLLPVEKALQALLVAAGVVAMVYTGLLLTIMPKVPFWHTLLIPAVFAVSSLSCGIALVVAVLTALGFADRLDESIVRLLKVDAAVVCIEAILVAALCVGAYSQGLAAAPALLCGELAVPFWVGVVFFGMVFPLVFEVMLSRGMLRAPFLGAPCAAILCGGACMRACVVLAGLA